MHLHFFNELLSFYIITLENRSKGHLVRTDCPKHKNHAVLVQFTIDGTITDAMLHSSITLGDTV